MRRAAVTLLLLAAPAWAQTGRTTVAPPPATEGGGGSVVLDLGDDGTNESSGLLELATTGDTNGIFSEPAADKLLVDVSQAWPQCDAATTVPEAAVTTHEAALSILWAQLSGVPLTFAPAPHAAEHAAAGADPITITEAQVSDLLHTVDTDDQTAPEVGYSPTTPTDWTDPDPADVGDALDKVAGRVVALESGGSGIGGTTGATDEALLRSDGAGGSTVQASAWTLDDAGLATIPTGAAAGLCLGAGADTCLWESLNGIWQLSSPYFATPLTFGSVGGDAGVGYNYSANRGALLSSGIASSTFANVRPARGLNDGLGSGGLGALVLIANGTAGLTQTSTETTMHVEQVNSPSSQTCADTGDGTAGFLAVTVSGRSNTEVTQADASGGCTASLSETGATRGQVLVVSNVSNAGGTLDFADNAGVQEVGAGCSLGLHGVAVFHYITDRWLLRSCIPTN